jgi:hypothetical protein
MHEVRRLAPHAHIVARSRYQLHRSDFELAGAHAIFGDEEEVGRALAEHVLAQIDAESAEGASTSLQEPHDG